MTRARKQRIEIDWFAEYVRVFGADIEQSIRKYAYIRGMGWASDDVVQAAWETAMLRKEDYNPRLSAFPTWVIGIGKGIILSMADEAGKDSTKHAVHRQNRHLYHELEMPRDDNGVISDMEERNAVTDEYHLDDETPQWLNDLWGNLDERERTCLKFMVALDGAVSSRKLAPILSTNTLYASRIIKSVREKARSAIDSAREEET